jgi:hypothetical protein
MGGQLKWSNLKMMIKRWRRCCLVKEMMDGGVVVLIWLRLGSFEKGYWKSGVCF